MVRTGIELFFFLVAGMVLCFAFRMRIILILQGRFSCCWAVLKLSQGPFCSSCCPVSKKAGGCKKARKRHNQDSQLQLSKGISMPYGVKLSNKTRDSCLEWLLLLDDWPSISQEWWATALSITGFDYSFCSLFFLFLMSFSFNSPYLNSWVLTLLFSIFFPIPLWGERLCGV